MKPLLQISSALVLFTITVSADSITHGTTTINMDFVNIGYVGNVADSSGYGAVSQDFRIGIKEVTIAQFAMARAADSRVGSGNEDFWNDGERNVGIGAPATMVNGYEAMRFLNWLTSGDAFMGAYRFSGDGTFIEVDRNAAVATYETVYVLPTEDEWYKAAYFNGSDYSLYADGTSDINNPPIMGGMEGWNYGNSLAENMWETGYGAEEQNGTFDMMGNAMELTETMYTKIVIGLTRNVQVARGGESDGGESNLRSSFRNEFDPGISHSYYGFRVAVIPEPSTVSLLGLGSLAALIIHRKKQHHQSNPPKSTISSEQFLDKW